MQDWQEFVAECWRKKNIGKPYAGKPHVRFDEGAEATPLLYAIKGKGLMDAKALDFRYFPDFYGSELPYEGAKEMLLVDDVENGGFLKELLEDMYDEFPAPKKKNK